MQQDLDAAIAALSLEEQVGQLIAMSLWAGVTITPDEEAVIRDCHLGGAVLFSRNVGTPEETRALTARLQELCGRPGLPAIIAADQEGGRVARLKPPATSFPSAMAIGATGSADHARRWGLATARELRSLGINMDFAPVLDVNNNPRNPVIGTRSYGERPEEVARLGLAAADGLREGGVAPCAKHFPGHGDTGTDSHYAVPSIPHDLARLRAVELVPFRAAIADGFPAIMSSHIIFPDLDPDLPGTLSPRILTGLLRDELGFDGLIVSDAMDMAAIVDGWGIVEGCVRYIAAGGDLVEPLREEREVHAAIVAAVRNGRIPESRIRDAAQRVLRLKAWLGAQSPADPAWLGHPDHRAWSAAMGRDALTLIRDDAGLLPLDRAARVAAIEFYHSWHFQMAAERPTATVLDQALADRFPNASVLVVPGNQPTPEDLVAVRAAVDAADVVLLGTRGANRFPAQADFVASVLGLGKPVVAVALADPYDSLAYPAAPTALAAYGADPTMLDALGAVLAGEETARGTLPVTLTPDAA
jgi:beta-N-acetylhexosaminidase